MNQCKEECIFNSNNECWLGCKNKFYQQGREDAMKELPTSLYCDGFNDGYPKGRADAIDELSKEIEYCLHCGMGKDKSLEHLLKVAEKIKEQKNE